MLNVLKADLYRISKDKMFTILIIICGVISVALPAFVAAIYMGIAGGYNRDAVDTLYLVDTVSSPSSAFGLVLAIFILIFLGKDSTTLRNKVIGGITRRDIFFSNVLLCVILYVGFMLAHTLVTFAVTSIFFNVRSNYDILHIVLGFTFKLCGLVVIALMLSFLGQAFKNIALGIVLFVILAELTNGYGAIVQTTVPPAIASGNYDHLIPLFNTLLIVAYGSFQYSTGFTLQADYNLMFLLSYFTSLVMFGMAFVGFGYLIMQRKDLK